MKILFFARRVFPDIGGVETHVREVSERLIDLGHEVIIVAEGRGSSQQSLGDTSTGKPFRPKVMRIPVGKNERRKKFEIWRWLWNYRGLMREADIIHCHDVFFWYLPFRFLFPSKKIFTTFHGYETVFPPEKKAIRMRELATRLSHGTINVGDYIRKWYGTRGTYTTYGGAALPSTDDPGSQMKNKLDILFIGRMDPDTGGRQYVKLLDILKTNAVEYLFTGLGDGRLRATLEKYGKTPGFVEDISSHLRKADIVFASSYLAILQSLSHGKLVVSLYDNPLKKDYLTLAPFAKWIIAESSENEAYKKIKYYILNPNRLKQTLKEEQEWAKEQTWDHVTKLYLKLWKKK